jgi:uncharacterized protein with von Willebrand factor type A (vWA) domain
MRVRQTRGERQFARRARRGPRRCTDAGHDLTRASSRAGDATAALQRFGELLACEGVRVTPEGLARFGRALAEVDLARRDQVFWAGAASLTADRDERAAYARAFDAFWFGSALRDVERARGIVTFTAGALPIAEDAVERNERGRTFARARYSALELDAEKRFVDYTPEEFARFLAALAAMRVGAPRRPSRRVRAAPRGRIDVRRILRDAMAFGGEPIAPTFRHRTDRPRRVVALCDVSGSMEKETRALLAFFHAGVASGAPFEAFSLGTRTVRLTRALAGGDPAAALRRAALLARDWGGGTRLGATLRAFLDTWGQRGLARGAVVAIVSDGWERGDVALLEAQMARLARLAYRVVWINPRKAADGYEPLAAGMAAALPYVDVFVSGHNLASLEELVRAIFA